ncbi:hypothetical protein JW756_06465 [Candidatus Woesearchaeota archaeon]|nr:hypothetical protein [Candidatus Woesearchaeota archaeon]
MAVKFKQKCEKCKTNYVIVSSWRQRRPIICYECEKKDMEGEITDPAMKKMFDIPEDYYKQNSFLRQIKINYMKYKSLTQPQIDAFKKTVDDMKKKKPVHDG